VASFPARPQYLRDARRAVAVAVSPLGLPAVFANDVLLVVDELSANAVEHGLPGRVIIVIHADPSGDVAIRVASPGPPDDVLPVDEWRPSGPHAISGRGLGIVKLLSSDVDVFELDGRVSITTHMRPATFDSTVSRER
jgi:anti-sigma regulatory factor (Ser/Thr protein kinase)